MTIKSLYDIDETVFVIYKRRIRKGIIKSINITIDKCREKLRVQKVYGIIMLHGDVDELEFFKEQDISSSKENPSIDL